MSVLGRLDDVAALDGRTRFEPMPRDAAQHARVAVDDRVERAFGGERERRCRAKRTTA
jgi:hypothetical protein